MCEAYLFGSVARGDDDRASDVDVLLLYDRVPSDVAQLSNRNRVAAALSRPCNVAEYSRTHLERLFSEGHLFAWHLHLEARGVPGWKGCDPFPEPSPYAQGLTDAANFARLLSSSTDAFRRGTVSPVYEAGIVYVALRNIGMSLSAMTMGRPSFGRTVPFEVSAELRASPPCSADFYETLIAARHASQRGLQAPTGFTDKIVEQLDSACLWANTIIELARERESHKV